MVSIVKRMTKLRALLAIRIGPGAAVLPPNVTSIYMNFALKSNDGHLGPRKFWRIYLPQLKYHNPGVPMRINRTTDQEGPAVMTIHFTETNNTSHLPNTANDQAMPAPGSETPPVAPNERIVTISMKHRHESEILLQLMSKTKATPVQPTPEELQQIRDLEEQRVLRGKNSVRSHAFNERRKHDEAMLAHARGEVAAAQEA